MEDLRSQRKMHCWNLTAILFSKETATMSSPFDPGSESSEEMEYNLFRGKRYCVVASGSSPVSYGLILASETVKEDDYVCLLRLSAKDSNINYSDLGRRFHGLNRRFFQWQVPDAFPASEDHQQAYIGRQFVLRMLPGVDSTESYKHHCIYLWLSLGQERLVAIHVAWLE